MRPAYKEDLESVRNTIRALARSGKLSQTQAKELDSKLGSVIDDMDRLLNCSAFITGEQLHPLR